MRYSIAFLLLLMTIKGATMVVQGLNNLQTDYFMVPLYASTAIESMGADVYIAQLMEDHKEYLSSLLFGAAIIMVSVSLWRLWYHKYFDKEKSNE